LNLTISIEHILLDEGKYKLIVRNKHKTTTKALLIDEWYRDRTKFVFNESLKKMYELIKEYVMILPVIFLTYEKRCGILLEIEAYDFA
jgi:hypothetical protein